MFVFFHNNSPPNIIKKLYSLLLNLITIVFIICNIVNYISDDEMIAGCTVRIGNGESYILEDWCHEVMEVYENGR